MTHSITLTIKSDSLLTFSLNGADFYCQYSKSSNGKYILAFTDSDVSKGISGHRKTGKGYYFLFAHNVLTIMGRLERPNDGKVADNGRFIINDWLFTDETKSIGYAFNYDGEKIIRKRFKANLLTNALSNSGQFALFITCNSSLGDNNIIILTDLTDGKIIWRKYFGIQGFDNFLISDNEKIDISLRDGTTKSFDWNFKLIPQ